MTYFRGVLNTKIHAAAVAKVGVDDGCGSCFTPGKAGLDTKFAFGRVVVIEDAGLCVEAVAGKRRLATHQTVMHGGAQVRQILFDVAGIRAFDDDESQGDTNALPVISGTSLTTGIF